MTITDGAQVSYVGPQVNGLGQGDLGLVLEAGDHKSHVRWDTGGRTGVTNYISNHDLKVEATFHPSVSESARRHLSSKD